MRNAESADGVEPTFCDCCGRLIKPGRAVWLEFDNDTGRHHRPGEVPEGHESLGVYPFGATCAATILSALQ